MPSSGRFKKITGSARIIRQGSKNPCDGGGLGGVGQVDNIVTHRGEKRVSAPHRKYNHLNISVLRGSEAGGRGGGGVHFAITKSLKKTKKKEGIKVGERVRFENKSFPPPIPCNQ